MPANQNYEIVKIKQNPSTIKGEVDSLCDHLRIKTTPQ